MTTFWHILDDISAIRWKILLFKWRFKVCINSVFRVAPKNSLMVSHRMISPRRDITRPGYVSCNEAICAQVVWYMMPSCWNLVSSKSYSSIAGKKNPLSYGHNAPNWRFHHRFRISKLKSHIRIKKHTKRRLLLNVMASPQLLEDSLIHK